MKIKKGDKIKVIAGKDRGKESVIQIAMPVKRMVTVEGVNEVKRHLKAKKGQKSEIVTLTKPIHVSNVMIICSKCNKPTRLGYKFVDNKKYRVCRKCNEVI